MKFDMSAKAYQTKDVPVVHNNNVLKIVHYENMPMQYTVIFHGCKNDNLQLIFSSPEPKAHR